MIIGYDNQLIRYALLPECIFQRNQRLAATAFLAGTLARGGGTLGVVHIKGHAGHPWHERGSGHNPGDRAGTMAGVCRGIEAGRSG